MKISHLLSSLCAFAWLSGCNAPNTSTGWDGWPGSFRTVRFCAAPTEAIAASGTIRNTISPA